MKLTVLIEDKYAHQDPWISLYKSIGSELLVFSHQFEFLEWCDKNKNLIPEIVLLVTDQKTPGFDIFKTNFLENFKLDYPMFTGVSVLSNSLPHNYDDVKKYGYELVLGKEALSLEEINERIRARSL